MSAWYNTFNDVFFITISTLLLGSFAKMLQYCLKSKCEEFSLCNNLIKIKRRVDLEVEEEKYEIENKIKKQNSDTINSNV